MPAVSADTPLSVQPNSTSSSFDLQTQTRKSNDKTISGVFTYTSGTDIETGLPDPRLEQIKTLRSSSQSSLTNGNVKSGRDRDRDRDRALSTAGSILSVSSKNPKSIDYFTRTSTEPATRLSNVENASDAPRMNGSIHQHARTSESSQRTHSVFTHNDSELDLHDSTSRNDGRVLAKPMFFSPPVMTPIQSANEPQLQPIEGPEQQPRQSQRQTLSIPQPTPAAARASRDFSYTSGPSEEVLSSSGRFSPTRDAEGTAVRRRRASMGLTRRSTRANSDAHLDEVPPDEDAARWTQAIKEKRASRRRRQEEEDDDRVIVGKKVEEGHVNWVTAYNMLTGIRFTVSRTNAKMNRELTDADFDQKQKMSFDVTGSEQTPGAKYDFKFKDYSPWVFRHLRGIFGLDPADYLMSLTSKYILSELGSPGKSGSFFYFSRDYKYIIKTIHHAEHKLLRRILRDYYAHVKNNPNTLISQFYGLHRVKIAYGRKIHFVVMNNLFPPHRDIHQTFDLKGSTIGRDLKEDVLTNNPRATLKDLNWLRRDMHLEFDQRLRQIFIEQLQRDVVLLQRLQIMDYSLLVGIHDLEKGNDDNVREKTLKVFQPGGERDEDDLSGHLMRTPSRLESAKKARELRQTLKHQKPVPMGLSNAKMPEHLRADDQRHNRIFYSDDGGIRATHEDGRSGETIYYLGVIDCLTHYGFVKRVEHFWKGMSHNRHQISPIPPHPYGERFLNFITGITMTKEEADRRAQQEGQQMEEVNAHNYMHHHHIPPKHSTDGADGHVEVPPHPRSDRDVAQTLEAAEKSTDAQTSWKGRRRSEEEKPDRTLLTHRHADEGRGSTTLPIVQEGKENSSHHSSSHRNSQHGDADDQQEKQHIPDGHLEQTTNERKQQMPEGHAEEPKYKEEQQNPSDNLAPKNHETNHSVYYTVTAKDDDGEKQEYHMHAPLDSRTQDCAEIKPDSETRERPNFQSELERPRAYGDVKPDSETEGRLDAQSGFERRASKPPRIDSGIIPTLTPLVRDEEIGFAR